MTRSHEEQAQTERLEQLYMRVRSPVMVAIERSVCGCDYGSNSWTTRAEAQQIAALLGLRPGVRLLDVGAGSGWPGLYLAAKSGCDLVLVDLPIAGLRIAAERAASDGIAGSCLTILADAALLPFAAGSFDAISHSDLLCCLSHKRAVLATCRQVIRDHGCMVFTVIAIAPGLSAAEYRRAVANGPEFVAAEADYATLLAETGWVTVDRKDVTGSYAAACRRKLQADGEHRHALQALIGHCELAERQTNWSGELAAIADGLLRRELLVANPDVGA